MWYNYCNFYKHERNNNLNKATGGNNTSILLFDWGRDGVEPPIVKAHKYNSIYLKSDAL